MRDSDLVEPIFDEVAEEVSQPWGQPPIEATDREFLVGYTIVATSEVCECPGFASDEP